MYLKSIFLFSDTIKNNIAFGVDAESVSDKLIEKAAKDAGIHDNIIQFPDKYETVLGERGINISGGQKQRISIARALIKSPEILVLDDCLSAVDNETEEVILNAIRKDLQDKTAIIISHRISSIKYADKIIVSASEDTDLNDVNLNGTANSSGNTVGNPGLEKGVPTNDVTATGLSGDAFIENVAYKGAFEPGKDAWIKGWTKTDKDGLIK